MGDRLYLHIPSLEELSYRQEILSQPDTMSYNKGYELKTDNYDNETGCIDFKKEYWMSWYSKWISNEPERFYAYITEVRSNNFIGEVSFHYDKGCNSHLIGIVIEAKYRGKGYCSEGLIKLAKKSFEEFNLDKLRNEIPIERKSAILGHKKAGFKEIKIADGNYIMELTAGEYFNLQK